MAEPAATPSRKWATSVMAGSFTTLMVYLMKKVWDITLDPGIEGTLVVFVSGIMAYIIPNADPPEFYEPKE